MPTGHGSVIFDGSQPGVDASVVGVCRAKGAVMMGKTVSPLKLKLFDIERC